MIAPAPWVLGTDADVPGAGRILVLDRFGEVVADVGVLGRTRQENEANARTIVEAVNAMVGRVEDGQPGRAAEGAKRSGIARASARPGLLQKAIES